MMGRSAEFYAPLFFRVTVGSYALDVLRRGERRRERGIGAPAHRSQSRPVNNVRVCGMEVGIESPAAVADRDGLNSSIGPGLG